MVTKNTNFVLCINSFKYSLTALSISLRQLGFGTKFFIEGFKNESIYFLSTFLIDNNLAVISSKNNFLLKN